MVTIEKITQSMPKPSIEPAIDYRVQSTVRVGYKESEITAVLGPVGKLIRSGGVRKRDWISFSVADCKLSNKPSPVDEWLRNFQCLSARQWDMF